MPSTMWASDRRGLVRALMVAQAGRCAYCGRPMTEPDGDRVGPDTRTIDHVVPTSRGGTDDPGNLCLACLDCNGLKADRLPLDFIFNRHWSPRP